MQKTGISILRSQIAALERGSIRHHDDATLPFGIEPIDRHMPDGGLALGAVHEIAGGGPEAEHGAAPALFAAGLLARRPGPVLWILGRHDLFTAGLAQAGLDPRRLVLVQARQDALLAMEEGLRFPDPAGVVCELEGRLDLVASRRLPLAAEGSDVLGLVLRRSRRFNYSDSTVRCLQQLAHQRHAVTAAPASCAGGRRCWPTALAAREHLRQATDLLPSRRGHWNTTTHDVQRSWWHANHTNR